LDEGSRTDTTRLSFSGKALGHAFLAACLFFGVTAQLLLKFAVTEINARPDVWHPYVWVISGLAVYGIGTAFWMLCLIHLDLSYAYPFTGLTYVLMLGISWFLFDDRISLQRLMGVLLICLGVALIPARSGEKS
jgi:multidrug transporter EmrE-like cation transporter